MLARASTLALALALTAPASAQVGVSDGPSSIQEAHERGQGIRISGTGRQRVIPETYTVQRGDTLWEVTGRFYGSPWEWPRVWSFNPSITNPHWIYPLDRIRLLPAGQVSAAAPQSSQSSIQVARQARRSPPGTVLLRQQGFLDPEALRASGVIVGAPGDHMLLAPYDEVYIEFDGTDEDPRGEYTIFREVPNGERDPRQEVGQVVRIAGTVRIESYDRDRRTARGTIVEALDPIERGFRVAPVPRRFDLVPPRVADRDISSRVIATLNPRELVSEQQLLFLNVGRDEGIQPGNRVFILRAGDEWRDTILSSNPQPYGPSVPAPAEPEEYPAEVRAEGRVVDVRDQTAAVIVTRAIREVQVGDGAEIRAGY